MVIGDTVTEALREKVGGFLLGFSLILTGFLHWLPLVAAVRKNQEDLLKYNEVGFLLAAGYPDTVSLNRLMASMCWSGPFRPAFMVFTDRWVAPTSSQAAAIFSQVLWSSVA